MAIHYKDYYATLGVPRSATAEEIKQAFRKLARKFHPDAARGQAGAEEKFKEINEAYEVLKDPEKRKKYDSFGSGWQEASDFRPPPGWGATPGRRAAGTDGADFEFTFGGTGFSDFFETFFGSSPRGGETFFTGEPMGGGRPRQRRGTDLEADILVTIDEAVRGSTRQVTVQRSGGPAGLPKRETYQVKIPPGVREGQRIRLAGRGESGVGGGLAGDLFLRVRLAEYPFFRRQGSDLLYDLDLAPWEAVLGTRVEIPTPTGSVMLRIPPGTIAGQKFRLRGQGLPDRDGSRGNIIVVVQVQVPSSVSSEEERLWEELARLSSFQPRA
jgi:curved DNA-binding protein